jgi:hypothetical protein
MPMYILSGISNCDSIFSLFLAPYSKFQTKRRLEEVVIVRTQKEKLKADTTYQEDT